MVYPLRQAGGAEQERLLLVQELNGLETFISTAEQIVITSLVTCPVAIESLGRKAVIWSPGHLVITSVVPWAPGHHVSGHLSMTS